MGWFGKKKVPLSEGTKLGIETWLQQAMMRFAGTPETALKFKIALEGFQQGHPQGAVNLIQGMVATLDQYEKKTGTKLEEKARLQTWLTELQK